MLERSALRVPFLASLLLAAPLVAPAAADVLVVDVANGSGADFTLLSSAVAAAAEGDVILVREGSYGGAFVDGKSLVIQAEANAEVLVRSGISVRNLGPAQNVLIRGIDSEAPQIGAALLVSGCQGAVHVEDAQLSGTPPFTAFPGGGVDVQSSSSVVLTRCVVQSFEHQFLNPGLRALDSVVTLHQTTVNGSKTFDQSAFMPGPSGDGVELIGSVLTATDSLIVGGVGGDYVGSPRSCFDGGPGGTGLVLFSGSRASLFATTLQGGPGGQTSGTCSVGATGAVSSVDGTSTLSSVAQSLGTLALGSPARSGQAYSLDVGGEPNAFAWVLYGTGLTPALFTPSWLGALHAPLDPFLFETLGTLPASGVLSSTLTASTAPGVEGFAFYAQLLTLSSVDGRLRLGTGTALTLLDPAF